MAGLFGMGKKVPAGMSNSPVGFGTILEGILQGNVSEEIAKKRARDAAMAQSANQAQMQRQLMGLFGGAPVAAPDPSSVGTPAAPVQPARLPSLRQAAPLLAASRMAGVEGVNDITTLLEKTSPKINFSARGYGYDEHDETNIGRYQPEIPEGGEPFYDGRGNVIGYRALTGHTQFLSDTEAAKSGGKMAGELPFVGPTAEAESAGREKGAAPYTFSTRVGPNGEQITASTADWMGMGPTSSQNPGQAAAQGIDYTEGAKLLTGAAERAATARTNATNFDNLFAGSLSTDPNLATPAAVKAMEAARSIGLTNAKMEDYVNNAVGYRQLSTQQILPLAKSLGANPSNRDAQIIQQSMPGLSTPSVAAGTYWAMAGAAERKKAEKEDFFANWTGDQRKTVIERAWRESPQSKRSIFQDPIFDRLQISGKPAVTKFNKPYKDGKRYGIFRPGTKYEQAFELVD